MTIFKTIFSNPIKKFGIVDIIFAIFYLSIFLFFIPPHTLPAEIFAWGIPILLLSCGIIMLTGKPFAKKIALWVASIFLGFTIFLITALLWTAGYLQGVYGQLGKGFALITLLSAALVIELMGIWPYFQIKALSNDNSTQANKNKIILENKLQKDQVNK